MTNYFQRLPCFDLSGGIQHDHGTPSLGAPGASTVRLIHCLSFRSKLCTYRAVDNQVYVSTCSPARDLTAGYHAVSFLIGNRPTADELETVGPFYGC